MAENLYGRSEPCEPTGIVKTEEAATARRGPGLYDELGRRIRGKYDGPKIDNYDKFRKCNLYIINVRLTHVWRQYTNNIVPDKDLFV